MAGGKGKGTVIIHAHTTKLTTLQLYDFTTLPAIINKVRTKTNAIVWKHDFEKQEWMSLLALLFLVRDFMFFFPACDDDVTNEQHAEEGNPAGREEDTPTRTLPRERDVGQLLRKAHEGKNAL